MSGLGGSATGEIDAPIERVWATLTDIETIPLWQKGITKVETLERDADGQVALAVVTADAKVRELAVTTRFVREGPTRLTWKVESGDVKTLDGQWVLEELETGLTRATYEIEVDPGRMLRMLVRGAVEDAVRERLVTHRPAELAARVAAQG